MAQQTNAAGNITNIWIQDANGQQQMIKVIHATPAKGVPIPVSGNAVRAVLKTTNLDGATIVRSLPQGAVLSPQVLQTLVKSPRTPVPKSIAGQLVAIPLTSTSNGSPSTPSGAKVASGVQFLSPVVLNTPQKPVPQQSSQSKSFISPILDHSGSRKRQEQDHETGSDSKRRRMEKGSKGLRHFSMKVCEKVKKKGVTSYNEVADELVAEFSDPNRCSSPADQYDQKNIRRRVYDALNVLMAMNIISKEKKEIKWLGLPSNSVQEVQALELEKQRRMERIKQKTQQLHELILQQIAFKSLVQRNKQLEKSNRVPAPSATVELPFLVINTNKKTVIDCSISSDKMEYLFTFDDTFEIHDDIEVLKRMGLSLGLDKGQCSEENVQKAKSYVPKALEHYVDQLAQGIDDTFIPESIIPISHIKLEAIDADTPEAVAIRAGAVTPSMSVSTGFSDSEEDHEDEDNSDVDIN